ncbi:hypothetical protein LCGC14_1681640 [marine sediment metagenome]|uniref:Cupin type-2 domain-containing protein n=1 Tax=marine sediment metagenome TaxID=412755 RepID=A0A0F9KNE8_9ZZZZ
MQNVTRGKIWGNTSTIFNKNNVEIARIEVKTGGYCSKHKHAHKFNFFFVEFGKLEVTIFRPDAGQVIEDVTVVEAGGSTYVEPNLYHKFKALENTVAYEVYWIELDVNDIEREVVGGMEELK